MAEQLGEAILSIRADTQALDAGLARARQSAEQAGAAIGQSFTKSGRELQTAANGLQYYIDAQGRARDATGKFITNVDLQAAGLQKLGSSAAGAAGGILAVGAASSRAAVGVEALKVSLTAIAAQLAIFETVRRIAFFSGEQITEVDKASAAVRTLGVDSRELGLRLEALSLQLGNSVSKVELVKAAYDVASSGFADAASATQILKASALGAQGGFTQLDDVVRAVTGVINAYGLAAADATKIVDQFLQTQNDGVITVRQYAAEIGNVSSIAAAGGVGLDQLNAAIATATLRGVPVSQTFTGIRQALSSILKPSQQAAELAASLGIQFNVSALKAKGLAGVLADVQQKTGGAADKIAILLGSVEAQAAIQPLLNDNLVKYNELVGKQANANGAAAAAAQINADTISGQLTKIGNGFKNLATNLDSVLSPVFRRLLDVVDKLLLGINKALLFNPSRVREAATEAGSLTSDLSSGPRTQRFTYQGKTYTGSALEIRRALTRDIVLGEVGGAQTATASPPRGTPPAAAGGAVISPDQLALIQRQFNLEIAGLREKLDLTRQLAGLDAVDRVRLEGQVALNEKLRSIEDTRLKLQRELAKPKGAGTGSPAEQDPAKILNLQNQLKAAQVEVDTIAARNQQAEADAVRTQQDRLRQTLLERDAADQKLVLTARQTDLERQALQTGIEVSRTAQLRLQTQDQLTTSLRAQQAAQEALAAEQARPEGQQNRQVLTDLVAKLDSANASVRQAYADAGQSLVSNARSAAEALRGAQEGLQSTLRGGFDLLTPELQRQQIEQARAAIQPLVDQRVIRKGIDISTPEQLFRVASFAEGFSKSQDKLNQALAENANATQALTQKDWNVYVSVDGASPALPLPRT